MVIAKLRQSPRALTAGNENWNRAMGTRITIGLKRYGTTNLDFVFERESHKRLADCTFIIIADLGQLLTSSTQT